MDEKVLGIDPEELAREYQAARGFGYDPERAPSMATALRAIAAKQAPEPQPQWGEWQIGRGTPPQDSECVFLTGSAFAYRVRKTPAVTTGVLHWGAEYPGNWTRSKAHSDTHRVTLTMHDGVPVAFGQIERIK